MTRRPRDLARPLSLLALLLALLVAGTVSAQDDPPTAREVIDRAIAAVGAEKLTEKTAMTVRGTFSMPAQGLEGQLVTHAKAPDHLLVEVEIPGFGTSRQGYSDGVGWSIDPATGAQLLQDEALAQLADQANYYGSLYREEDLESLTMVGETEFQGTPAWQIEVVTANGMTQQQFFAQDTGLLIGLEAEQHTPMGVIPTTSMIGGYEEFDGVTLATETTQSMMGMQQIMSLEEVSFGPIDDAVFALPPEIAALSEQPAGSSGE